MKFQVQDSLVYLNLAVGDAILPSIEQVAAELGLGSAWIQGIGVATGLQLGFYRHTTKDYAKRCFAGDWEILSLSGNLTLKEGQPFAHLHGSFSAEDFSVVGGHLFGGEISAAGEFWLHASKEPIHRAFAPELNLSVWDLP